MRLKIEIDADRVLRALLRAPREFTKTVRVAMKNEMTAIGEQARTHHRFTTRSGALERSVKVRVSPSGFRGEVYLERGIAIYGPRIHRGWGTWKPDRFLTLAFKEREPVLIRNLNRAMERGFEKVGL